MTPDVSDRAAFYRAALWLGLVPGAEVVAWAESLLIAAPDAPIALVNLAVVDADDVTGLRHALLRLGPERSPWPVVQAIFGLAGQPAPERGSPTSAPRRDEVRVSHPHA